MNIELSVNGRQLSLDVPPLRRLLDVLREDLGLTGTKEGCGEGECGACTVLLNGAPVNSCLIPIAQVQGARIVTIEGLAGDPEAERLQRSLVQCGGVQCGFCTPGVVMSAYALLRRQPAPTAAEVRQALAGNICRCTGYQKITEAVTACGTDNTPGTGSGGEVQR